DFTNRFVFGRKFPAGYYQSSPAIFVVILTPIFVWLWQALGDRQPSSPVKFSFGLLFVGLGAAVIATASLFTAGGAKVGTHLLLRGCGVPTLCERCFFSVGLSTTTKLAPHRLAGLMMGVWFLSISFGNFAAGIAAGHFEAGSQEALVGLFSKLAAVPIIAALALLALTPLIKKLMGKVR